MTPAATLADQARHYAAVRARLWGAPRRQWVKREWRKPVIVEVQRSSDPFGHAVREVLARDRVRADEIIDIVAFAYALPRGAVLGRSHVPRYTFPRQLAMTLVHRKLRGRDAGSLAAVGRLFDRDHTTVMYAVRKLTPLIEQIAGTPPSTKESIE